MMQAITLAPGFEEFAAVAEQMNCMIGDLRSSETRKLQHGDVEKRIAKDGNELFRRLENEQHKLKTRLSRGEKRNRKRMATVLILDFIHVLEYVWKAAYAFHSTPIPRA